MSNRAAAVLAGRARIGSGAGTAATVLQLDSRTGVDGTGTVRLTILAVGFVSVPGHAPPQPSAQLEPRAKAVEQEQSGWQFWQAEALGMGQTVASEQACGVC